MAREFDFTTYIKAIDDPSLGRNFDRLSTTGTKAFDNITRAANQASAAAAGLIQGRGSGGLGASAALQKQATETRAVTNASAQLVSITPRVVQGEAAIARSASQAAQQHQALARSLTATSVALNVVQGPLGPLAGRFRASAQALASLTGFQLGAAGVGALAFTVARLGNNYQVLEGRLRPYFQTQRQVNSAMQDVISIAAASRSALEPVADLYTKLTQNAAQYGFTQQRVSRITRLASQAATLSGGTEQSRAAGLYQFAQGISSNRLGGDELRSLLENLPALADAIAKGMGVTTGALRQLGAQGALTAQQVAGALERSATTIEERFGRLPVTLATASTAFSNAMTVTIGKFDEAIHFSSALASILMAVAGNLRLILSLALGLGTAFAAVRIGRWVSDLGAVPADVQRIKTAFEGVSAATRAMAAQEAAAATARNAQASRDLAMHQRRVAQLETEIALTAAQRNQALAVISQGPLSGVAGATSFNRAAYLQALAAEQELMLSLKVSTADLARAKAAEAAAMATSTAATRANAAAQETLQAATVTGGASTSRFARIATGFIGTLNPWVIGITALAAGIYYLATAQSDAERATDRARAALELYGSIVDETTGRVRDLSRAERERTLQQAQEQIQAYRSGDPGTLESEGGVGAGLAGRLEVFQGDDPQRNRYLQGLAARLRQNGEQAEGALREIYARRNAGDQDMAAYIRDNVELIHRMRDLGDAARTAQESLNVLHGGTATDWTERHAQSEARYRAEVEATNGAIQERIRDANTLDDHARYAANLQQIYTQRGVPSPNDIDAIRRRRQLLEATPLVAGQERQRGEALRGIDQEVQLATQHNAQYRQEIESQARALTTAETAERDRNREIRQSTREQRDAIEAAKAAATTRLNTGLLALEGQRRVVGERAYTVERTRLLQTYDREIDALNERAGSSQRGTTAMIEDARRLQRAFETVDQRRSDILSRYTDEPRGVQRGNRDIATLRAAQARVGEGFYPTATLEQDVRNIEEGVRRPLRDVIRDYERQRAVQLLIIGGHENEAAALRVAFQLQDSMGQVTEATYQRLVANAAEEQRINDVLASRQRLVQDLQGAVDDTRQALTQFFTDVQTKGPRAAGDLARNLFARFQQVQIRQFVERITGGADARMRELISGRAAVDNASHALATQIDTTRSSTQSLSEAMSTAATSIIESANRIDTAAHGGASPAPPGSDLANWQNAGSGPQGLIDRVTTVASAATAAISRREQVRLPFGLDHLTSGFGARTPPTEGASRYHPGLDLAAPLGTAIKAALSGRVVFAGQNGGLGNEVVLDHGNGLRTLYGHMSRIAVSLGDIVRQGQRIGNVGSTGTSTGNHVHFGVQRNGAAINPLTLGSALVSIAGTGGSPASLSGTGGASTSERLADLTSLIQSLPPDLGGGTMDDAMAASLAAMRNRSTAAAAAILGANQAIALGQPKAAPYAQGGVPSARDAYNNIGQSVGLQLDKTFHSGTFFKGIGSQLGTALQGASYGSMASGFAKALGIKQSGTGAKIGGAAGAIGASMLGLPPELGGFVGGLIGGTIGGLFKHPKTGSAAISLDAYGNAVAGAGTGTDAQSNRASVGAARNVGSALTQISDALGAQLGSFAVSFGLKDGKYRVDTTGRGIVKTKKGAKDFGEDEEAAVEFAIRDAIADGAIKGISAASQRILQSGQDLQRAIEKAVLIESIPKQLMQRTNPVLYAVTELNRQFVNMINALKEGGATAEQFADAQKLYELERADAIKQASESMFGQIQDYLTEMMAGPSSPLNKKTVYENAQAGIQKFVSDVTSGKVVDQGDLLDAAKNFQDASRNLNGSSSAFFTDFDWLFSLLNQAKANAEGLAGGITDLPPSPFSTDQSVLSAIALAAGDTTNAVNNQTTILATLLGDIYSAISAGGGAGDNGTDLIAQLPAFAGDRGFGDRILNRQ